MDNETIKPVSQAGAKVNTTVASGADYNVASTPVNRAYTAPTTVTNTNVTREVDTVSTAAPPRPTDLVRWGSVIAGLFAALSTLATLTVLGIAIGAGSFTPGQSLGNLGIGAGIWGAISALIAFAVGGWIASRTAAVTGHSNGILNGAAVWFVAIPLLLYVLGGGIGSLLGVAGSAATTAVQAAAPAAAQVATDPGAQATAQAGGQQVVAGAQATAQALAASISPADQKNAADTTSKTAWGILLALGLAAAAAIAGGFLGARSRPEVVTHTSSTRTTS